MQKYFLLLSLVLVSLAAIVAPPHTIAYETDTHEDMSAIAAAQSANLNAALPTLGITSLVDDKLEFLPAQGAVMTALEWIRFGAKEEDAVVEVGSPLAIFRHHFYNPLTGSGLYYVPRFPCNLTAIQGTPSPDWALGENGVSQNYSFIAARSALHKGLTEQSATEREKNLALMFHILGRVIHHIQDMAQPQHTRNDPHGPKCLGVEGGGFYEKYTNNNRGTLPYLGYDAVYSESDTTTFDAPRKFWTTSDEKGIADYSNRGFVTTGTNFDQEPNPFPSPTLGLGREEDETALCNAINMPRPNGPDGQPLPCIMTFVETPVVDQYRPSPAINPYASTFSIFNADMMTYAQKPVFTLNTINFDAAHQFLIPRAVGYSAGLFNYFFRGVGKLTISTNANDSDISEVTNQGTELLRGTLALYYDTTDNDITTRHQATLWSTSSAGIAPGENIAIPRFAKPTGDNVLNPEQFLLVFRGSMGEEEGTAIAINTVAITCTSGDCSPGGGEGSSCPFGPLCE